MDNQIKALAQHLGLDYFTYNNRNGQRLCYIGMTQEEFDSLEEDLLEKFENRDEVDDEIESKINGLELLENELVISSYDDDILEYGNQEYLVVSDEKPMNYGNKI